MTFELAFDLSKYHIKNFKWHYFEFHKHISCWLNNMGLCSSYYLINSDIVDMNRIIIKAYGYNVVVIWVESNRCCRWWWGHECCHCLHNKCLGSFKDGVKKSECVPIINLPGNWTPRKVLDILNDITLNVVILKRENFPPDVDKR